MHNRQDSGRQDSPLPGQKTGRNMMYMGWLIVLGLLTVIFGGWEEGRINPNQQVNSTVIGNTAEVKLQRNPWGHYLANGTINGGEVTFLVDTGATYVSVPKHIADKLDLKKGTRGYSSTANGTIEIFMTTINQLELGAIDMRDVRATINPHMKEDEILLGMSFLKKLELVQQGDTLLLRQHR